MNELSDLEICKRIAEIEYIELMPYQEGDRNTFAAGSQVIYNPLTDDALCFKLMVKHDIDFYTPSSAGTEPRYQAQVWSPKIGTREFNGYSQNPNKAICLAIIEANKHKGSK